MTEKTSAQNTTVYHNGRQNRNGHPGVHPHTNPLLKKSKPIALNLCSLFSLKRLSKVSSDKRPEENWCRGFSAVEMIVYAAILSMVFIIVINTLLHISRSLNSFQATSDINDSTASFLERVVREIRMAESVNVAKSTLNSHPGKLVLNIRDEAGQIEESAFYISGDSLVLEKGGTSLGSLIDSNATTTNLIFRRFSNATSSSIVRVEVTFESQRGNTTKSETFFGAAVLRGSY